MFFLFRTTSSIMHCHVIHRIFVLSLINSIIVLINVFNIHMSCARFSFTSQCILKCHDVSHCVIHFNIVQCDTVSNNSILSHILSYHVTSLCHIKYFICHVYIVYNQYMVLKFVLFECMPCCSKKALIKP